MNAVEKTGTLQRVDLPLDLLDVNELNPNEMDDAQFNMLVDNFEKVGFTEPMLVRPKADGRYRVIGGHHRLEAARLLDFKTGPCTVITDPDFDEDMEKFQVVRQNIIRGRMSPAKFAALYGSLSTKYEAEIAAEMFGFVEQEQFDKMVAQMAKSLPSELQSDFKKAAKEIKTIDGLSKLLNSMFNQHGDSLPYGYMIIDFGGKESVWLRLEPDTKKHFMELAVRCRNEKRTMDDLLGGLIAEAANGKLESTLVQLIAKSEEVELPFGYEGVPTKETMV